MADNFLKYCQLNQRPELLKQWDTERNFPLQPECISASTSRKVWWKDDLGHSWYQSIYSRTALKCGCPVCAGRKILSGFNDLATTHPLLAAQWHPSLNGGLSPQQVSAGSGRKVWWICEKGHEWQALIASRVRGCGCPICSNRIVLPGFNDLATTHPELAAEWHPSKNGDLTPQEISYGYDKKVWWRCGYGHEWQAAPKTRVRMKAGCPVCANYAVQRGYNDLKTLFPHVAAEWHPTKNGALTPEQVVAGNSRTVWWRCPLGHEWRAKISDRTRGTTGCPYCTGKKVLKGFNDLASQDPDIAKQWHPTLNGALTPEMVTTGSNRRVWWICSEGHVWRTSIWNRTYVNKRTGCPVCAGKINRRNASYYQSLAQGTMGESEIKTGEESLHHGR